ncbi:motility associated factor glycosyltransferase family protein [Teredinibacter purpureus]|uniref:motility associated factor glycosyltransferase family protein n=1 Tax=Teredinibacter purpureus TaxID=2731756 RepID=UPI0005F7DDE0|nr:6-hydroxymethylpterin diphosphokinase MptE-like protein [Teredinibacter purpureus]
MTAFKDVVPTLYQTFNQHTPTQYHLQVNPKGYLDLVNNNNKSLYSQRPDRYCRAQVNAFLKSPFIRGIGFEKVPVRNNQHLFPTLINTLIEEHNNQYKNPHIHCAVPIGFMIITGCGLGYSLEDITHRLDVRHLCIVDPNPDSFYASLHSIDWQKILNHFTTEGRSIRFFIGVDETQVIRHIRTLRDEIGLHNLVYTAIFQHFNSPLEASFVQHYLREYPLIASGTGYFDDEQIGLAHTAAHLHSGVRLFNQRKPATALPPAYIIGNGPSLDQHIDYLKKHGKNALLFSCGTAISSLAKVGIKPDFHIETERTAIIKGYLENGTTTEYRKGITLLCLNTVAPSVVNLFDETYVAVKPNDAGELLLTALQNQDTNEEAFLPLAICNPTVTNAGLSFALAMGFENIQLFGVDLGMKSGRAHHSALSIHMDIERKTQKQGFTSFEDEKTHYAVPANFGGTLATHPILHDTNVNMALLLSLYTQSDRRFVVYNPNDGAFIDGTRPTHPQDLPTPPSLEDGEKSTIVTRLLSQRFTAFPPQQLSINHLVHVHLAPLISLKETLKLPLACSELNARALLAEFHRIHAAVTRLKDTSPISYQLIRGSTQFIFALMTRRVLFLSNEEDYRTALEFSIPLYNQFIEEALTFAQSQPLQWDTSEDTVATQLGLA